MTVIPKYHGIQLEETRRSLLRVLNHPSEAREQIRRYVSALAFAIISVFTLLLRLPGAVIIRVTYGVSDTEKVKEYVQLAVKAMESARAINRPGAFVAEFFQFLQYFPTWAPGGGARKYGDFYRPIVHAMRDVPFDGVKEAIVSIASSESLLHVLIWWRRHKATLNLRSAMISSGSSRAKMLSSSLSSTSLLERSPV